MSTYTEKSPEEQAPAGGIIGIGIVAWLWVLIPFGYGLVQLLSRIPALFG